MEPTYTILGGDGNQYGPIKEEQFREWVKEGRAGAQTQVWRSDTTAWCAASALPELGVATPIAVAAPMPIHSASIHATAPIEHPELERQIKNGASWFYWIAALSLIN